MGNSIMLTRKITDVSYEIRIIEENISKSLEVFSGRIFDIMDAARLQIEEELGVKFNVTFNVHEYVNTYNEDEDES